MTKRKSRPGEFEPFVPPSGSNEIPAAARASRDDWPFPFKMFADGLYLTNDQGEKVTFIAPPLEVLGQSRDVDGNGWGLAVRFPDPDGRPKIVVLTRAALCSDRNEVAEALANAGFRFKPGQQRRLKEALANFDSNGRLTNVDQTGWIKPGGDFMLGHEAVMKPSKGKEPPLQYRRVGDAPPLTVKGSLDEWREKVSRQCAGNSRLVIAACMGFVGPTLAILNKDGFGLHYRGESSKGKSSALAVAASVAGVEFGTWATTLNGMEGLAINANDLLLPFDEISEVEGRDVGPGVYKLFNGSGKGRALRNGDAAKRKKWRVAVLSTGEVSLEQKMQEADPRAKSKAGQEVRLIDVDMNAGKGFGLFDIIPDGMQDFEFADFIRENAEANSGHAIRPFIEALQADGGESFQRLYANLQKGLLSELTNKEGQVIRVLTRFAIVAAAGEYATQIGLTGWDSGEATKAALALFKGWQAPRSFGNHEARKVIETVRTIIQKHHAGRFHKEKKLDDETPKDDPILDALGYVRTIDDVKCYCFMSGPWKGEVLRGHDPRAGARYLRDAGFLLIDSETGRLQRTVRTLSGLQKLYAVKATILEGDDL